MNFGKSENKRVYQYKSRRGRPHWNQTLHKLAPPICLEKYISIFFYLSFGMWHVTYNMWHLTCDMWHVTHDIWSVTHDMWSVTHDMWSMTHDKWHVTHMVWWLWTLSQKFRSLALTVWKLWCHATCDMWHMTDDTRDMACDTWHREGLKFSGP